MSIFNSLTTAVAGINAQSTAFTNLSNNIANSQTVGYKASTTSFQDFVSNSLSSSSSDAVSDGVGAVTHTSTQQQGTVSASTNSLAVAISGNGFFDVSKETGQATSGTESFSDQQYYTRNGDFYADKNGYLVNTSGYYLDGYQADATTGTLGTSLTQLNVSNVVFRPTETTKLTMTGDVGSTTLPSSGAATTTTSSTIYDSQSGSHTLDVTWTQDSANPLKWTVSASDPSDSSAISATPYTVTFDSSGAIASVTDSSGDAVGSSLSGATASIPITANYNGTSQSIALNIGTIGSSSATTLSTTSSTSTTPTLTSDSVTSGTYEGVEMESDGSVMAEFSNGDTQLVGKIALSSFANADGLSAVDGQAYVGTAQSGSATTGVVGANGTGTLETSSVESSTTDLTSDLSGLIVAQEAYTANTKVVTTANQLLQSTIAMIQ
ncbi:flagellar hook protein FlgE [Acetobacter sacchari]|uniref:Flagellar hook protein FlgE n=1 Tax=Acetobacter sacchari TaxID=2661687 RepID=A0ABS3LY74_9PROT|nr:flagellar hook protein FlgE [Acetobacter sacchari]MBO1360870.1 flagellar hook protein FlgE [Acetobacter sacchari]